VSDEGATALDQRDPRWHVRVRELKKAFGTNLVLDGIDLDIERGKVNVIIGASGAGKSVLIKHFMCLLRPDSGAIWVDGTNIFALKSRELSLFRRKFGLVFQFAALFDSLSVEENCAFPLREHTKKSNEEIRDIVADKLNALGIGGTQKKYPGELSGGMRKRVGLARALVLNPEILVTSVVISHDMASVFRIAERIAMLHERKILEAGPVDVIAASQDPFVHQFLRASGVSAIGRAAGESA
jgi:phospholipid/cholesterol/gamma-HCH transport system ATP-binding protein